MKLYDKYYNELLKDCGIDYTEYNSLSTEELDELSWKFFQLKKDNEEEMLDCLIILFTRLYIMSIL